MIKSTLFILLIISSFTTPLFAQNPSEDPLAKETTDKTLLKDGSEKAHIKPKKTKKSKDVKPETSATPSTKGLPTDVD
jgi:hypothetical protein